MVSIHPVTDLVSLLDLEKVKPDAWLGSGPPLGWGRLYGGQVVAQALRAACNTVEEPHRPQSLHAYFVRAGDEHQPVLYEVERVRDSRSFATRQVVAYQAGGAILNCIASFHAPEPGLDIDAVTAPEQVPAPAGMPEEDTPLLFERRSVARRTEPEPYELAWMKVREHLGDDPFLHACAFAYLSDEFPLGAALGAHPVMPDWENLFTASLDHAIWFHRPLRADDWLLFELRGGGVSDARGLGTARVFSADGRHVASIAQEALAREREARAT
ncbi:MAG TPA: acyl-CoA thioesterase domain-containing protein [Acidimicrobiia bacterium]|nr:acyl-CoA thioesterase domain-containing protein [Acidimicrobiia bacterium]